MKIYFVRHGQTEFNAQKIIQGGTVNSELTKEGIRGAERLGSYLADIPFTAVYSSTQKRAIETAQYILKENHFKAPAIQVDDRLREIEFGRYDGKTIADFDNDGYYEVFRNHPDQYESMAAEIGAEAYSKVVERAFAALQAIIAKSQPDDQILIVAHSIVLTSLIKFLQDIPVADYRKEGVLANTSVTCFVYQESEYQLRYYNYVPKDEN